MLSVKLTRTVNGIATNKVGASDTRATNQDCSKNSRHWNGRRNANLTASTDIANKAPTACMGPEMSHFSFSRGNPADQWSAPLVAIGVSPFPRYETDSLVVAHRLR